jgi:hypothetical protein
MSGAGDLITVIGLVLLILTVNIVWAIGLASDYRAHRFGWLFAGVLLPPVGIVRGFLAMRRPR